MVYIVCLNLLKFKYKNKILFSRLFFLVFIVCAALPCRAQLQRFSFSQPKMASPFIITFYDDDSAHATITAQQCFALVDKYVLVYSDYIDSSELNLLCAKSGSGVAVPVSAALMDIMLQCKTAFEKSGGSFDITLGPLTRLWRKARKEKIFPNDKSIKEKLAVTGFSKIIIGSLQQTILLTQKGMQLDLGGIAQGCIAQKVINFLKENNIVNALVNVSGDIAVIGKPPGMPGWTIGINVPQSNKELLNKKLLITNKAVTTSGDVYQYMEYRGKRYSHIINPKTGYGITSRRNVTVIANDATTADWLTKACSLLPINKAKKLTQQLHAEFLITEIKKDKLVFYTTKGFKKYWKR
jgi:FAD:protein FMN transferase